ncbi:uncharacterized protein LOC127749068 [Frankliniella occidentalis]|uniref:Uncharacterized protein LOC127749068 n=1 Tax=Frankliniella occidentalis TaxID=133901 RepID=A0A9C6TWN7_FRAOC|nr:uncharacterized protein LOC127749068 [Frankliniella occidentalis]
MSWNTTFPSLTLCPNPEGRRDPARVAAAVQRLAREFRVKNETSLRVFVERLAEATLYTLSDIPASHGIPGDRFLGIIEEVRTILPRRIRLWSAAAYVPVCSCTILATARF